MSDDETYKNKADILKSREEFPGWRRQMEMLAQDRGDVEGIFSDLGQNPNVGYQAIPPASIARRKAWNELSIKLSGKVGRKIDNAALSRIWADANSPYLHFEFYKPQNSRKCTCLLTLTRAG